MDANEPLARAYQAWFEYLALTEDGKKSDTQFSGDALMKLIALKDRCGCDCASQLRSLQSRLVKVRSERPEFPHVHYWLGRMFRS